MERPGTLFAPVAGLRAWTSMAWAKHLWTLDNRWIVRHHQSITTHTRFQTDRVSNLEFANAFAGWYQVPADNYASRRLLCRMVLMLIIKRCFLVLWPIIIHRCIGFRFPPSRFSAAHALVASPRVSYRAACTVLNSLGFLVLGLSSCSTFLSHSCMHYLEKRSIPLDVSIPYLSRYLDVEIKDFFFLSLSLAV